MNPMPYFGPNPWRRSRRTDVRRRPLFRRWTPALAALALPLAATAPARELAAVTPLSAETSARIVNLYSEPCARDDARWILTPLISLSQLSGNREDWLEAGVELLHRATPDLVLGGRVESRTRNDVTDVLYTALLSHIPAKSLEWHAAVTVVADPKFSVEQGYTVGGEWRFLPRMSALFDYGRLEFPAGAIDQFKPGLVWWFSECNFLTGRYAYGRAFGETDYDAWVLRLDLGDIGLPDKARLAFSYSRGADPEKQIGFPAILTTADAYGAFVHWPLARRVELILGAEYEDRKNVYTRTTGTVGLSLRF